MQHRWCGTVGHRPHRLSARTAPFQGAETGSIPVGATLRPRLGEDGGVGGAGEGSGHRSQPVHAQDVVGGVAQFG